MSSALELTRQAMDFQAMMNRRQISIVWTTAPISSLKNSYNPGDIFQINLQRGRNFIRPGQIGISFRPVINYGPPAAGTQMGAQVVGVASTAQKMMQGITGVRASDFLTMQSITINGNQACSQTNQSLVRPRNIFQNYIGALQYPRHEELNGTQLETGVSLGSTSGTTTYGEQLITDFAGGGVSWQFAGFKNSPFPRALISQQAKYNMDFSFATSLGTANKYYQSALNASTTATTLITDPDYAIGVTLGTYPLLPLLVTPSVCAFKQQQERFSEFRNRFLVSCETAFPQAYSTSQDVAIPVVAADICNKYVIGSTTTGVQPPVTTPAFSLAQNNTQLVAPVNGPYGVSNFTQSSSVGNSVARYLGTIALAGVGGSYAPVEQFTNVMCYVKETSIELNGDMGIDMMDFTDTQMQITYQINQPEQVLSSYLQSGLFGADGRPLGAGGGAPVPIAVKTFMDGCLLGRQITFSVTELVLRIPYYIYNEPISRAFVTEQVFKPQSYYSIKSQSDVITSATMSQRIPLGSSQIVVGCMIFFTAANTARPWGNSGSVSDTCLNYSGARPLPIGHLASVQSYDSYSLLMSDIYLQVDNMRINTNAPPIGDPQYSTWMSTQTNLEMCFGKSLNIPFHQALLNRNCVFIQLNPYGDRGMAISDSVLQVNYQFDFSQRDEFSKLLGETSYGQATPNVSVGQFQATVYVVTQNSMVNCDSIRTQ